MSSLKQFSILIYYILKTFSCCCLLFSSPSFSTDHFSEEDKYLSKSYLSNGTSTLSISQGKGFIEPSKPITSIRIDLHGYMQEEAKNLLTRVINRAYTNKVRDIYIITGRGKHKNANGKRGVLKTKVPEWLSDQSLANCIKKLYEEVGSYRAILNHPITDEHEEVHITDSQLSVKDTNLFALAGDPDSQFIIGFNLFEDNNKESIHWLRKAAAQGHPDALFLLGYAHAIGRNVKYDPKLAAQYYEKAVLLGHIAACINLGTMHWSGEAGKIDIKKARYWFKIAARKGSIQAQQQLGIIYFREKNYSKAFLWNKEAADNNEPHAQVNLGCMYLNGLGTNRNVKTALELFEKSGKGGISEGWMRLGLAYLEGNGIEKNYTKAAQYLLTAALAGNDSAEADSQYFLSIMYREGYGFKKDINTADRWLLKAATNNHPQAQFSMGLKYEYIDINEALTWYIKSSKNNYPRASYRLFELYNLGIKGIPSNHRLASKYLQKAAKEGDSMALLSYGIITKELQKVLLEAENTSKKDNSDNEEYYTADSSSIISEEEDVYFSAEEN